MSGPEYAERLREVEAELTRVKAERIPGSRQDWLDLLSCASAVFDRFSSLPLKAPLVEMYDSLTSLGNVAVRLASANRRRP